MTGLTFNYIDTVFFTWTSDITRPWMNLWCAPNATSPQSKTQAYHAELSSANGTNPQSFPYSEYYNNGICHMQLEDLAGDNWGNTPAFEITSNVAVAPQTWGLSALGQLGKASEPTAVAPATGIERSSIIVTTALSTSTFPLSPSTNAPSAVTPSGSTTSATALPTSTSSPSQALTTAAKAGISIGSIFSGLALAIAVLLFGIARSRKANKGQDTLWPNRVHNAWNNHGFGGGSHSEMTGVARPAELHGIARAELEWAPRTELSSVSER